MDLLDNDTRAVLDVDFKIMISPKIIEIGANVR